MKLTALPSGQRLTWPLHTFTSSGNVIATNSFDLFEISARSLASTSAVQLNTASATATTRRQCTCPPVLLECLQFSSKSAPGSMTERLCTSAGNKHLATCCQVRGWFMPPTATAIPVAPISYESFVLRYHPLTKEESNGT